jgi:hypothetical protein
MKKPLDFVERSNSTRLDCGNLELVGDVKKAEALVGRGKPK